MKNIPLECSDIAAMALRHMVYSLFVDHSAESE